MLPLSRCRELIRQECRLSDSEIELLREQLYALAHIVIDVFAEKQLNGHQNLMQGPASAGTPTKENFRAAQALVPQDDHHRLEERAAIMEYEGDLTRDEAERHAFSSYLAGKAD